MSEASTSQRVRLYVFEHFRDQGRPPVVEELMTEFDMSRDETVTALRNLSEARHVALVKGTARILMAFPFSAIATPFRVRVDGRSYFANCAWDAIAFNAMLGADIVIDSFCHHCAAPIRVEMRDGRATGVDPEDTIVYLALRPAEWWEDIITTCSNTMVFFAGPDHRDASDLSASPDSATSLTPQQVHDLGKPIYETKLSIDYQRPGREQLLAHFASLGLTGPYWQL